jgi:polysaccharide export outer membrane protein
MRSIRRGIAAAAVFLAFLCLGSFDEGVYAQTVSPSAEQLDIFKNLSQDQQDAILRQLGGNSGGLSTGGIPGTTIGGDRTGQNPQRPPGTDQDQTQKPSTDAADAEPRVPVLKGEDWVIIETAFHLAPRPLTQSLQAQYLSQGLSFSQAQAALQGSSLGGAQGGTQSGDTTLFNPNSGTPSQSADAPPALTSEERSSLSTLMDMILAKNPYQLSRDGELYLPGFAPIPLAGLTDDDATLRLKAEPAFARIDIRLTRLPLKKTGLQGLKPFGYDLFDRAPSTFAPVTNVPVPADYVVGPGDQLDVILYGSQNRNLRIVVGRDGRINIPELGPVNVGGQLFNTVKATIEAQVLRQMIGVRASVSMGDTRSIRVFVLGEARHPGSYTISGLGTITSALFASGGVRPIGSLRRIQLKRQGAVVRQLDLYDLLIKGDTTDDTKLLPGDVIFIPPVGPTVSVDGEVRRPAIYEIKNESNVGDVIQLAGGLTAEADHSKATLTRIDENQQRIALQVDTVSDAGRSAGLRNGDVLRVARLRPTLDSGVLVQGHLYQPGVTAFRQGLRLSDVIHSVDELRPNADIHYLLIRREMPPDRRIAVLSADLGAALAKPGSKSDLLLMPRDRIMVFDLASGRDRVIQPLMDELRVQANLDRPSQLVRIDGLVKVPGEYPLESGMTISDLVRAGGGLADAAYGNKAELTRSVVVNGDTRRTDLIDIDLAAAIRGDTAANIQLQPFDNLSVKEVSEWHGQEAINLTGEVRFPGRYAIRRGETLRSVIARAGGLTSFAFADGAVFTRTELRRREQDQLDLLATRIQKDLTILAIQATATSQTQGGGGAASALAVGQQLFNQLRAAKAVGRLVIDLNRAIRATPGSANDLILRNGDELIVPRMQQEVTVIGEVQNGTSHLYKTELSRDDYIALSGGTTKRADRHSIYVVHANGSVIANSGNRWFENDRVRMQPGDTVVVPLDAEHLPPLPYWQAVTTILYNVAIAVAAVHAL